MNNETFPEYVDQIFIVGFGSVKVGMYFDVTKIGDNYEYETMFIVDTIMYHKDKNMCQIVIQYKGSESQTRTIDFINCGFILY